MERIVRELSSCKNTCKTVLCSCVAVMEVAVALGREGKAWGDLGVSVCPCSALGLCHGGFTCWLCSHQSCKAPEPVWAQQSLVPSPEPVDGQRSIFPGSTHPAGSLCPPPPGPGAELWLCVLSHYRALSEASLASYNTNK